MADEHKPSEPTAVDDVRRVRRAIAEQHQGNLRQHMDETNRLFQQMQARLNLKIITPLTKQND